MGAETAFAAAIPSWLAWNLTTLLGGVKAVEGKQTDGRCIIEGTTAGLDSFRFASDREEVGSQVPSLGLSFEGPPSDCPIAVGCIASSRRGTDPQLKSMSLSHGPEY